MGVVSPNNKRCDKYRTKPVLTTTSNPKWNETFTIQVVDRKLRFLFKIWGKAIVNVSHGLTYLDLAALPNDIHQYLWLDLQGNQGGRLRVVAKFTPDYEVVNPAPLQPLNTQAELAPFRVVGKRVKNPDKDTACTVEAGPPRIHVRECSTQRRAEVKYDDSSPDYYEIFIGGRLELSVTRPDVQQMAFQLGASRTDPPLALTGDLPSGTFALQRGSVTTAAVDSHAKEVVVKILPGENVLLVITTVLLLLHIANSAAAKHS
eukprot:TRINITY_DN3571_c0_g1_i7.p1 TRINITY_DN3571_c0_g1~~TRINITY_DN3571_c0_g1_i7.p1  ORF type:complete len:261 (+),score=56.14 TRINITY_DN3571_c0_g1_i7:286-1068(+)